MKKMIVLLIALMLLLVADFELQAQTTAKDSIDKILYNYVTGKINVVDTIKTDRQAVYYIPQWKSALATYKYLRKTKKYSIEKCVILTVKWEEGMPKRMQKKADEWYKNLKRKGN